MQVAKNTVVAIDYKLSDANGEVLDASEDGQPLEYVHGGGNIIPGLENALEGKDVGEDVSVQVEPSDAYGERSEELKQDVPKEMFQGVDQVEAGMRFQAQTQEGTSIVTVTEVGEEQVTVDANHPLAGETLNFEVKVNNVREATQNEIDSGQVEGQDDS
jgi:FKBP-type peptidyl-prolyl cis-trans isomerase SlyD